ncbi:phage tail protein [Type-E symbiont of Plautia stali]|uniref:phage tail protein n=1 Tax=Type-E symbiont of Plautia stali TaxID=1560357 RepID=UPI00073F2954|nr:phage tail protein [Type-E symbiont of Plautia stali]
MTDFEKKLAGLLLPTWMKKGEPAKLLKAARRFWVLVYGWITWPVNQFDPLTCSESLLRLMAWDRDITRFNGEPLTLFRKRVAYAFINARDAGSVEGFIAIFERLGIGYVEVLERQPDIDWDVIIVRLSDSQIARNTQLLMQIIRQYGRTCRRYQFEVMTPETLYLHYGFIQGESVCYAAPLSFTEIKFGEYSAYSATDVEGGNSVFSAKI